MWCCSRPSASTTSPTSSIARRRRFVCDGDGPGGRSGTTTHLPWLDQRSPSLVYITWYDEGVRAMDISNPFAPVFIGHYLSPRIGRARPQRPPHPRDLPGSRHRPAVPDRRQRRRADGAALHRPDPRQASDSGRPMKRIAAGAIDLSAAVALGRLGIASAPTTSAISSSCRSSTATRCRRRSAAAARPSATRWRRSWRRSPAPTRSAVVLGRDLDGDGDPGRNPLPSRSRRDPGGGLSGRVRDLLGVRAARRAA